MSLDGFIAGPGDDISRLFAWMSLGDTDLKVSSGDTDFELQMSAGDAENYQEQMRQTGAIVSGRRMFDVAGAWGGKHPMGVPVVVVTHTIPQEWVYEGSPFTFVTDGVEAAIEKANEIGKDTYDDNGCKRRAVCRKVRDLPFTGATWEAPTS